MPPPTSPPPPLTHHRSLMLMQINIAAVLFMWCTLPAFGAASYVPSLVLGGCVCARASGCAPLCACLGLQRAAAVVLTGKQWANA